MSQLIIFRKFSACFVSLALLTLAACSTSPENVAGVDNPFTVEDERRFGGLSQEQLYEAARSALNKSNYTSALEFYSRLEALYPFSPYARQAQLETIYASYKSQRLQATIAQADRFIKQHPRHSDIDYAYYLRGLANFDQAFANLDSLFGERDETRDPTYARTAFTTFAQLIRGYPASAYAPDARKRMVYLKNRIAEYELHIAHFYLGREAWVAASNRAKTILEQYQGTPAIPDALLIQVKAYNALGLPGLANDAAATLKLNYPGYAGRDDGSWLSSLNPFGDDAMELPPVSTPTAASVPQNSRYESLQVIK